MEAAACTRDTGRVVLIGIAQERASIWRSWKAKGQEKAAHPHMEWGRQMAFINHFYFYLWDPEWGAAFLEDQRLRTLSDLAVAERPRVGQAAAGEGAHRLPGARQWLPKLWEPRGVAEDLRPPRSCRGAQLLLAL